MIRIRRIGRLPWLVLNSTVALPLGLPRRHHLGERLARAVLSLLTRRGLRRQRHRSGVVLWRHDQAGRRRDAARRRVAPVATRSAADHRGHRRDSGAPADLFRLSRLRRGAHAHVRVGGHGRDRRRRVLPDRAADLRPSPGHAISRAAVDGVQRHRPGDRRRPGSAVDRAPAGGIQHRGDLRGRGDLAAPSPHAIVLAVPAGAGRAVLGRPLSRRRASGAGARARRAVHAARAP